MNAPLLETRGLRVSVPNRLLVADLNLSIGAGEFIALLGGNGTGKSLLLRTLAGLRAATLLAEARPLSTDRTHVERFALGSSSHDDD